MELFSLQFIERHENVIFCGPVGVGKSLWAQALGHAACRASYRVLFIRSDGLLKNLARSRVDNSFDRFIASHEAMAVGSRLDLHFLLPEGQIRVQAIVLKVVWAWSLFLWEGENSI